jgi:hypothetical protein
MAITINVNRINRTIDVDAIFLFCGVLRDVLVMTRIKFGCGVPLCGARTVHLSEVFGERDDGRRLTAIKDLHSENAVFFEEKRQFEARQTISDAVAGLHP